MTWYHWLMLVVCVVIVVPLVLYFVVHLVSHAWSTARYRAFQRFIKDAKNKKG